MLFCIFLYAFLLFSPTLDFPPFWHGLPDKWCCYGLIFEDVGFGPESLPFQENFLRLFCFLEGFHSLIAFTLSGDDFSPSMVKTCPCSFQNWHFFLLNVTPWSLARWRTVVSVSLCTASPLPPRSMSSLRFRRWGMSSPKALNIASSKSSCEDLASSTSLLWSVISPGCAECWYLCCGRVKYQLVIDLSQVPFREDLAVMRAVDKIFNRWWLDTSTSISFHGFLRYSHVNACSDHLRF